MRDVIRTCEFRSWDGEYMTVVLNQYDGDEVDRTVEEVMPVRGNGRSQSLPEPGDDVLVAWDSNGDAYCIGALACENQPRPDSETTTHTIANGNISLRITNDGKFEVLNGTSEVTTIISELIAALIVATTPTIAGPQPLSIVPDLTLADLQTRIDSFKV